MLTLNLKEGGKFDIPPHALMMVETSGDGCRAVISMDGRTRAVEELEDTYGYTVKNWKEVVPPHMELIEVNVVGPASTNQLTLFKSYIIARRDLKDDEDGAKMLLTLQTGDAIFNIKVAETREQITGEKDG